MNEEKSSSERAPLSILLFGSIEIRLHGDPLQMSRRGNWVLALLALRGGKVPSPATLAEMIWAGPSFHNPPDSLRRSLTDVRRDLGDQGWRLKQAYGGPLTLDLTDVSIDLREFHALVTQGDAPSLERALLLYDRGTLLGEAEAEIEAALWIEAERKACQDAYASALERLLAGAEESQDVAARERYLRRLVEADLDLVEAGPARQETAIESLIDLLAGSSRLREAGNAYLEYCARLKQVDAEPGPAVHARYLACRQEWNRGRLRRLPPPPGAEGTPPPHNLPHALTRLVGREEAALQVLGRLMESRLVTLTGIGGIGKTRLATQVAWDALEALSAYYPDGVWLVSLDTLSPAAGSPADPTPVAQAVAVALGVRETPGRSMSETLREVVRDKRMLLVLDNCEHVIDACVPLIVAMLKGCSGLRILATSREALCIERETLYPVSPLSVPTASDLAEPVGHPTTFLERYGAVDLFLDCAPPEQRQTLLVPDTLLLVAQICRRLDGIPLAIELAAARVSVLDPAQVLVYIEERFDFLVSRRRDVTARHRSLRAALEWSFHLLPDELQRFFAQLSVFRGGWSMETALSICDDADRSESSAEGIRPATVQRQHAVLARLEQLCDASWITVKGAGDDLRFEMLETLRAYGQEELIHRGMAHAAGDRHAQYFLALIEEIAPTPANPEKPASLKRLEREHDNLRAALEWLWRTAPAAALKFATAMGVFWTVRGYWSEGLAWLSRCLADTAGATPDLCAQALSVAAGLALMKGDYARAAEFLEERLRLPEAREDTEWAAETLHKLGVVAKAQGDLAGARVYYQRSLAAYERLGDASAVAGKQMSLGSLAEAEEDLSTARTLYEAGLALYRELRKPHGVAKCLYDLGRLAALQGDYGGALSLYEESIELSRQADSGWGVARALRGMAEIAQLKGDLDRARAYYEEALAVSEARGDRRQHAQLVGWVGAALCLNSNPSEARTRYTEALTVLRQLDDRAACARLLREMGDAMLSVGDTGTAAACYQECLVIARELKLDVLIAEALRGQGEIALASGDTKAARSFLEQSRSIWQPIGSRRGAAGVSLSLGDVARAEGRREEAVELYERSLALYLALGARREIAGVLVRLGRVTWMLKQPQRATSLYAAASSLCAASGIPVSSVELAQDDQALQEMRQTLGDDIFTTAWEHGLATTPEQFVVDAPS